MTIHQDGAVYTVDGFDDQCGAPQRAPLVGLAMVNPDGSVGLGLHVVTVPSGRGLQIDARVSVATGHGPWVDSAGNTGTFVLGASTGGPPRPVPTIPGAAIAAGSVTSAQLAAGAVTATQIAAGAVTATQIAAGAVTATQLAAGSVTAAQLAPGALNAAAASFGTCPPGQYLRGIQATGTVLCEPIGTPALRSPAVSEPPPPSLCTLGRVGAACLRARTDFGHESHLCATQ